MPQAGEDEEGARRGCLCCTPRSLSLLSSQSRRHLWIWSVSAVGTWRTVCFSKRSWRGPHGVLQCGNCAKRSQACPYLTPLSTRLIAKCAHEMPKTWSSFSLPGWCQHGQLTMPHLSVSGVLFGDSRLYSAFIMCCCVFIHFTHLFESKK